MTARDKHRGWEVHFDEYTKRWVYSDNNESIEEEPQRPCVRCGAVFSLNQPDACLGHIEGVRNACCGHGSSEEAYIQFHDKTCIRGFTEISFKDSRESFRINGG